MADKNKRKYVKKNPEYWGDKVTPVVKAGSPNFSSLEYSDVNKAGNTDQSTSRLRLGELGSTALATVQYFIDWLKPWELRWPQRIRTFTVMAMDQDVSTALEANYLLVEEAFDDFEITFDSTSDKSIEAAAFVDWCLRNMENQTLRQVARSAITFRKYGFSVLEKVYTKVSSGEYAGKYKIKRLPLRPQESIDINQPFVYINGGRDIRGVRQNTTYFMNSPAALQWTPEVTDLVVEIPRGKFMLFNTNADDTNPMGESPLISIYNSWREKKLISEYEVVGVTKDLGGLPLLEVPLDIMNRAAEDPNSPEAKSIAKMTADLANLHAGEQAYIVLPSDVQEGTTGQKQYSLTFKGIDGMGKQYKTSDLISQRKKEIYDKFGASLLLMGTSNTAAGEGYGVSDSKATLHYHYVQRDANRIKEVFNNDLIPQLCAMNGWLLTDIEMPRLVPKSVSDEDVEVNSSMIQRVFAVGAIPLTPEVINENLKKCGYDYRIPDEIAQDVEKMKKFVTDHMPQFTSRSGDGMAQGKKGNGTSDKPAITDNTKANTENAA